MDYPRLGREEQAGSRFREVLGHVRAALNLGYTRRRAEGARGLGGSDRSGILSLNVR